MAESGIIFDIKKFALHDGPGIRTTVFFQGCPLDCWWCHNPEGLTDGRKPLSPPAGIPTAGTKTGEKRRCGQVGSDYVLTEILKDVVFYEQSGGGVTFSGGEPLGQLSFLQTLLTACREDGIHTAVDTCGFAPPADFEQIYDLVDLFLYDLKLMDDREHHKYCSESNELIIENLKFLTSRGNKVSLRLPLIPGITDTPKNITAVIKHLAGLSNIQSISLIPYHKLGEDKATRFAIDRRLPDLPLQTAAQIAAIQTRFQTAGYPVRVGR